MGVFRFKRFEVVNERSAMKVNTDGVLLGALMTILPTDRTLLDIGTGTGTIALMAAQRLFSCGICHADRSAENMVDATLARMADATMDSSESEGPADRLSERSISLRSCEAGQTGCRTVQIDAIDIDEASAEEAEANFRNSPWSEALHAYHTSLDDFPCDRKYDLIFSNPPYFEDSLNAPEERRNNARHTSTGLSYREILDFASQRLTDNGRVAFVLPAETEAALCRHARMDGLHLFRIVRVRTVPRKEPSRIIAEFSRMRKDTPEDTVLTIQNEGKYTEEYLSLMRDFYLFA
jgi:tRNA1Val (adenine37-N6)-methyltransferase